MQRIYVLNISDESVMQSAHSEFTHKVTLTSTTGARLELPVGASDADMISSALIAGRKPVADQRFLSFHRSSIASLGMKLDHILLKEKDGDSYKAYAALVNPRSSIYMPIIMPEAIALALQECAPIYADGDALISLKRAQKPEARQLLTYS